MALPIRTILLTLALGAPLLHIGAAQAQTAVNGANGLNGNPSLGDAPGWPITIGIPGHYRLTSNVIVGGDTTAIHITVPGVTLDLNGYTILGPVSCSADSGTVQCLGPTTAPVYGIVSTADHTVIRNGRVRGFGAGGMQIKSGVVENMQVESNDGVGVSISGSPGSQPSRVSAVSATLNRGVGIYTRQGLIERAVVNRNQTGVAGQRFTLIDSLVIGNTMWGVHDVSVHPHEHGAVKGTVMHSNTGPSIHGTVRSLGGNLVDGAPF